MKKKSIYIVACFLLFLFSGCSKFLDSEPDNFLQDEDIYGSEAGTDAYMARLYSELPIEDFNMRPGTQNGLSGIAYQAHLTGEALNASTDERSNIGGGISLQTYTWVGIRNANIFIEKLPSSPLNEDIKTKLMGEAKFIRAYYYFGMVKRYGGLPIITSPQAYNPADLTPLHVPRNTEQECYDFIAKDLDEAIAKLPVSSVSGRINKYGALAFKSRVMLFPAAIAKYGTMNLDNVLGIPAADANKYFQAAYDAAKAVIDANKYSLYNKNPDKSQNYTDLFVDKSSSESIFIRDFLFPYKTHNYDRDVLPFSVKSARGYSSRINPTLEFVEQYEYINNADGKLRLADPVTGELIRYAHPLDLFKDKDPRLAGTVILPLAQWRGNVIQVQAGLFHNVTNITAATPAPVTGNYVDLYDPVKKAKDPVTGTIRVVGLDGFEGGSNEKSQTGFYLRKQLNPQKGPSDVDNNNGDTHFIDIRYAEVLLNYAEAALELNNIPDAKTAINLVRARAGIQNLNDADLAGTAGIDKLRRERLIELAFENFRYWDIRRWRIADAVGNPLRMNNNQFSALLPYRVLDDNTFVFRTRKTGGTKQWIDSYNYERIAPAHFTQNPKLGNQNPGY